MQPHAYMTLYDTDIRRPGSAKQTPEQWLREAEPTMRNVQVVAQARAEHTWMQARRPYYTVYPVAAESLSRITLDVPCGEVHLPVPAILIRFLAGHEPQVSGEKIQSIFAATIDVRGNEEPGIVVYVDVGERLPMPDGSLFHLRLFTALSLRPGRSLEGALTDLDFNYLNDRETEVMRQGLRYVAALSLLAHDPEIVQPDVLARDREKWERTQDPAIAERAIRRGKYGWLVGAQMETMPHYRRPHFALRWTGEGRQVPKIVAVKGAVVHRKKLTDVPQGTLDDEDYTPSPAARRLAREAAELQQRLAEKERETNG